MPKRLAYLVSRYPAISHTFILREVLVLRARGLGIRVVSINTPDRSPDLLTAEERSEAAETTYIKSTAIASILRTHLRALLSSPIQYFRGLIFALQLGGLDLRRLIYHLFYFGEAIIIGRWMLGEGLTHLHVHFATPAASVGLIATRCFPITYSLTVHGPDEFYDVPGYRLREKVSGAKFVVCIGMYARSQLMKITAFHQWSKFEICPLGVDPAAFVPATIRERQGPFSILCVGRLVSAKGQHILLLAADRLRREGYSFTLTFVGDGPDRNSLQALTAQLGLENAVRFAGAVNQDTIKKFYCAADTFVLPSFAEGIPVVLMEAMAMEVPCVTTFITGIPELIDDCRNGLLVKPSDVEGLVEAIRALMADPALRQRLGRAGRERIQSAYNLAQNTDRLFELFDKRLT